MSSLVPVHSVHFYHTDKELIDRLCGIVSSGLNLGNAVLLAVTQDHRDQLVCALEQKGVDMAAHIRDKTFTSWDMKKTLSRFMVRGLPHTGFFKSAIRSLLEDAKKSAGGKERGLIAFGEMVSALWDEGNHAGALALENLWNDVLSERAFHLHCAYPRSFFSQDTAGLMDICESHSHIVGATL
jgi:DcmR-like sensory protein